MTNKTIHPFRPHRTPTHLILFREVNARNVGVLSATLKVGQAEGERSRASCAILGEKHGALPKVFEHLGVAVATLSESEIKKLENHDSVEAVLLNEQRSIPPDRTEAAEGFDQDDPLEPSSLECYLRGMRDAIDLALKFEVRRESVGGGLETMVQGVQVAEKESRLAWHLKHLGVEEGEPRYSGAGVKVAVLDTGLDLEHPDFTGKVVEGESGVSFVEGEGLQDGNGHGTHCAGLVAGPRQPPGNPRYGVAPDASLYIGKVLDEDGRGWDSQILDGMDWAAEKGVRIISMSLGSPRRKNGGYARAYERLASTLRRRGILVIAAAGNSSTRPDRIQPVENPGACPSIMAVGALDDHGQIAEFSCGQLDGIGEVNVSAPGVRIFSSWVGGRYRRLSGTSMATPLVAGVGALLWQKYRAATASEIWDLLVAGAVPLGAGQDYGAGLVQVPR